MAKYRGSLEAGAFFTITAEADGEDEAFEAAFDEAPTDVCAHCSGWGQEWSVDLGEWSAARDDSAITEVES